jgi:hypothetical protein
MGQRIITHRGPNETLAQPVQDIAELRLAPTADVDDKQGIYVEDENSLYFYDYTSVLAESLPDIVIPTGGPGRWIRHGYGAGGAPSDLYRLRWSQEQVIEVGDDVVIADETELIISDLDVQGTLDVQGDLIIQSGRVPGPVYGWPNTVPAEVDDVIASGTQHIVFRSFTVDGHIDVQGDLYLIP